MPEPGDAEALVGTKLCIERRGNGRGSERGEIAQRGAAGFPRGGWLKSGGEFLDDFLGFGDAGGADALGAARGEGRGGIAGERALGGGELGELGGGEEKYLTTGFEVIAVGGESFAEGGVVGGASAEAEGDGIAAGGLGGVGDDFGGPQARGVFFEVGREVGIEAGAEAVAVAGEEVERLVSVAEPPLARGRVEGETGGLYQIEGAGVLRVLGRGEREREKIFGAVHEQRGRRAAGGVSRF